MSSALHKRLQRLEELLAARASGPRSVRRVILEPDDEEPTATEGEWLIIRRLVDRPDRPPDVIVPEPPPSTDTIEWEESGDPRFSRLLPYRDLGKL